MRYKGHYGDGSAFPTPDKTGHTITVVLQESIRDGLIPNSKTVENVVTEAFEAAQQAFIDVLRKNGHES